MKRYILSKRSESIHNPNQAHMKENQQGAYVMYTDMEAALKLKELEIRVSCFESVKKTNIWNKLSRLAKDSIEDSILHGRN